MHYYQTILAATKYLIYLYLFHKIPQNIIIHQNILAHRAAHFTFHFNFFYTRNQFLIINTI